MIRFTKEEKTAILFLLLSLFIGMSVICCKKLNAVPSKFDYLDEIGSDNLTKVNINKASSDELMRLKGVGYVLSGRIIEYRKTHGEFKKIEDIKDVRGIGENTYEKMKDQIRLE